MLEKLTDLQDNSDDKDGLMHQGDVWGSRIQSVSQVSACFGSSRAPEDPSGEWSFLVQEH